MSGARVHLVTRGGYEITVLAVFDTAADAQKWADSWNLAHLDDIRSADDKAVVGESVPHNPPVVTR